MSEVRLLERNKPNFRDVYVPETTSILAMFPKTGAAVVSCLLLHICHES